MSTYLALVNNVLNRLNEVNLDSSTFASARGIHAATKLGVKNAVLQINSQKWEWPFNYATSTQTCTIGQVTYSFPADYKIADWESFYIVGGTYSGETINNTRLKPIQRQEWYKWQRPEDLDNSSAGLRIPDRVFWNSDQKFGVSPVPNKAYVVAYNYWKNVTEPSAYTDNITIPSNFDWVIEQGALEDMYAFLDNDQRMALGKTSFKDGIQQMQQILIPWNVGTIRDTRTNFGNPPFFAFGRASNPMI